MSTAATSAPTSSAATGRYDALDAWVDTHFDEQVRFLQELVRVPTDTPPGNNAPHAERTAELLAAMGLPAEQHPGALLPMSRPRGLQSIINLIVRRRYGEGPTIALNAHGDVVPPGEGWVHDPYGGEVVDGTIYGRATAVSKCDMTTFAFAVRALESLAAPLAGSVELHFTYDEEYGGELGPGWLLERGLTKPDLMIAAGFSYQVVWSRTTAACSWEVTVQGEMAHAAIPDSGTDALQAAVQILNALYALNRDYLKVSSDVDGITHPLPERGADRRWHQHQRDSRQGRVARRPPHDSRRGSGRGRGGVAPHHRAGCCRVRPRRVAVARSVSTSGACCCRGQCGRCPATRPLVQGVAEARRGGVRRADSGGGHAALHRRALVCRARHSRCDLRSRAAQRARIACQARRRAAGAGRPEAGDQGGGAHAVRPAAAARSPALRALRPGPHLSAGAAPSRPLPARPSIEPNRPRRGRRR